MTPVWLGGVVRWAALAVAAAGCAAAPTGLDDSSQGGSGAVTSVPPGTGGGPTTSGGMGGATAGGASGAGSGSVETCDTGSTRRIRRLSLREIQLVLSDLLGTAPETFAWSAPDQRVGGFDTNAESLIVASGSFDDFTDVANLAVDAADVGKLAPCPVGAGEEACAANFVAGFAERAYGRAATATERARLSELYRKTRQSGDHALGIRTTLEAILSSPYFLYRTELGNDEGSATPGKNTRLTPDEAASALAFAITGARPDAALLGRAASDPNFLTRAVLGEEARRLIATPRAEDQLSRFLRQWLGVEDLKAVNKIPALFPDFTPTLKADLDRELETYLRNVLGPGRGTLSALFAGEFGFPSELEFRALYAWDYLTPGRTPPAAGAFTPVALEPSLRRGVLALPGWLAAHSPVHRSSPTDRGLAIRSRLFCQSLPNPPASALSSAPGPGDENATTRQKFELHASRADCSVCHQKMDPIGFGLEMMDALGRFRETENGLPVDSNGMLTSTDVDGPFRGPAELADKLLASRMVRDCFTLQLFQYVNGRDAAYRDSCQLERLREFFADDERSVADLMVELALQSEFIQRSHEP